MSEGAWRQEFVRSLANAIQNDAAIVMRNNTGVRVDTAPTQEDADATECEDSLKANTTEQAVGR